MPPSGTVGLKHECSCDNVTLLDTNNMLFIFIIKLSFNPIILAYNPDRDCRKSQSNKNTLYFDYHEYLFKVLREREGTTPPAGQKCVRQKDQDLD